jgi:protein-S-isoprenylcysteine O-methyltransferase Ste14
VIHRSGTERLAPPSGRSNKTKTVAVWPRLPAKEYLKLAPRSALMHALLKYEVSLQPIKPKLEEDACSRLADEPGPTCTMLGRKSTLSSPRAEQFLLIVMDLGERAFILVPFAAFVVALSYSLSMRPYNLLALLSESLMVFFVVFRRPPRTVTGRPLHWAVAFAGTALPLFLRPGGQAFVPTIFGAVLMFAGLSVSIWAILFLRSSFGLVAANRGLVRAGPYLLVRHPMYAGYMLVNAGFLTNNPTLWNLAVVTVAAGLQIARVFAEDDILAEDPQHAAFKNRVRYRLVPGVF